MKTIKHRLKKILLGKAVIYIVIFVLLVGAAAVVTGLAKEINQTKEKTGIRGDLQERFYKKTDLNYKGCEYIEKKQLVNILIIGTDQTNQEAHSETGYGRGGQADLIMLVTIDKANGKAYCLAIDRDTMTDIDVYGVMGEKTGTSCQQICLSYGFGTGREESCELTSSAVSKLFWGVHIDYYASLNMDAIPILNDTLGGVTVMLDQDLTKFDSQMSVGKEMTLTGEQAAYYVRGRLGIGDSTNSGRMERQSRYLLSCAELLKEKLLDGENIADKLYQAIKGYLITDMDHAELINLINTAASYENIEIDYMQGNYSIGSDGFTEFYADEDALREIVLERFYIKK